MNMLTFGEIIHAFYQQFPGLKINDLRPNGPDQLYIWVQDSPTNIIATYIPESQTFIVKTTKEEWEIIRLNSQD